jgi:hypothetical protein
VLKSNEDTSFQLGTGVLLQVADAHFLVTAGHVADCLADPGITLSLGSPVDGERVIHLETIRWVSSGELGKANRERDAADVAVVALEPHVVARLPSRLRFTSLAEIDPRPGTGRAEFVLVGYPLAMGTRNASQKYIATPPLALGVTRRRAPTNVALPFDRRANFALGYQPDRAFEADGTVTSVPDLEGISGCGVWRYLRSDRDIARFDVDRVRLVGIETSYSREHGWIRCTRIAVVLRLIYGNVSKLVPGGHGLRRAMEVSHPWLARP